MRGQSSDLAIPGGMQSIENQAPIVGWERVSPGLQPQAESPNAIGSPETAFSRLTPAFIIVYSGELDLSSVLAQKKPHTSLSLALPDRRRTADGLSADWITSHDL